MTEDIGEGDHSTLAAIPSDAQSSARLLVKEEKGIIAGVELAREIFRAVDSSLPVTCVMLDNADKGLASGREQTLPVGHRTLTALKRDHVEPKISPERSGDGEPAHEQEAGNS